MDDFLDLKYMGIAIPLALAAWRWLRGHNDRTLVPPASAASKAQIEDLVRRGRRIEAIKAIRKTYACDLKQAKERFDAIASSQRRARTTPS